MNIRDLDNEVKAAQAKVAYWQGKVALYGGAVHVLTLERMRANLARAQAKAGGAMRSWGASWDVERDLHAALDRLSLLY